MLMRLKKKQNIYNFVYRRMFQSMDNDDQIFKHKHYNHSNVKFLVDDKYNNCYKI